jgi:LemA protein
MWEWLGWIIAAIIAIVIIAVILIFNGLVSLRNKVDNGYAQIDVQLKKRYDLVPNLVETVKGYAKHEREVFENVTAARAAIMKAPNVDAKVKAENMLSGALKSLFAVAENYPDLKASANFMMLQEELSGIESKVAYARQFYNDSVMQFNVAIQSFPSNIVAGMFGFTQRAYLEFEGDIKTAPKVQF